jgi:hypothetical protein
MRSAQPAAGFSATPPEKSSAVGLNPPKARLPRCGGGGGGGCFDFFAASAELALGHADSQTKGRRGGSLGAPKTLFSGSAGFKSGIALVLYDLLGAHPGWYISFGCPP